MRCLSWDYLNKESPVRYLTVEEEWLVNGGDPNPDSPGQDARHD